jgi:hypothetical protein
VSDAARWIHLFLDVRREDAESEREFWAAATGWTLSPPRGEDDQFVTLIPERGSPWLKLQSVDGTPGVHLDLDADDREAAVARATALGATHAWTYAGVPVMRSPGGFVFCHTLTSEGERVPPRFGGAVLDQVCLDVPPSRWEAECEFWRQLTGRELREGSLPGFRSLSGDGLRILLQRLEDEQEAVTAHPDFATVDRAAETDRHVALGAQLQGVHAFWTVLRSPGGQVYCLTDRDPASGSR